MKTLIQKDLRENLKLASIGLLIFSLLLLQAYESGVSVLTNLLRGNWSGQANVLQPLLSITLLIETAFFCAVFGAALGWLQTRNEAHRDLWAFLIHRPLTRTEIFWGKAIAGLCLYVFGAGVPVLVLIWVCATPGHVAAPFEWEMVLPLITIFLTGFAYYFAGLLTGMRQARWFVSRAFGLALALVASVSVFAVPEFWMAHIVILIAVVVLATAAWGAYQSGGWQRGQPLAGKLALIVTMLAGCVVVLEGSLGLTFSVLVDPMSNQSSEYTNYQMTRDGAMYKVTTRDNETLDIVDLDGHPLIDPKTGQRMERKEFQKRTAYGGYIFSTLKHLRSDRNAVEDAGRFFNLLSITDKTLWYLDRHGKLTGYNGRTRRSVGSLDGHGSDGSVAFDPFLPHPSGNFYYSYFNAYNDNSQKWLASARTVYRVDFKDRSVSPVYTVTNDDEIGGYAADMSSYDGNQPKKSIFITTRQTIQLLNADGRQIFSLPYQPGYVEYPQVQLMQLSTNNSYAVWLTPDYKLNKKANWTMPMKIQWLGKETEVTKNLDLPVLHNDSEEHWSSKLLTALLPLPAHLEFSRKFFNGWNLFSYALSVVIAAIGWRLLRRYEPSTKVAIGWTVFVLVLGIPGLLTLLVVQEWPAREACPKCQQPRAVDREACEHCAAGFAPPAKNGTEIFEPLVKV